VGSGGDGNSAHFIFANLNGTIAAWDTGTTAFIQVTTPGAVYTGLAINGAQTQLYAANDVGTSSIDVFDSTFAPVSLAGGAFVDPVLPAGLVPFNVQEIGGNVYVTYAPAGRAAQTSAPLGAGAVAIFDEDGTFITQLIAGSRSPRLGESLWRQPVSASSSIICWSATSAIATARSTPSTRRPGSSAGRSGSLSARAARRAGFGPLGSGSAAVTAIPIPSTSLTGSTARRTGCSAPYSRTARRSQLGRETAISSQPSALTVARSPARRSTVVIADSTMAGPVMICARASASKS
jgi:hypothetical protein